MKIADRILGKGKGGSATTPEPKLQDISPEAIALRKAYDKVDKYIKGKREEMVAQETSAVPETFEMVKKPLPNVTIYFNDMLSGSEQQAFRKQYPQAVIKGHQAEATAFLKGDEAEKFIAEYKPINEEKKLQNTADGRY